MDVEQLFSERGLNTSKFVDLTRTELQDFEGNLIEPRIQVTETSWKEKKSISAWGEVPGSFQGLQVR